jgi:hypothetical protein
MITLGMGSQLAMVNIPAVCALHSRAASWCKVWMLDGNQHPSASA